MKLLKNILRNMSSNKWMSVATMIVITIVFFITTVFVGLAYVSQRAVKYYEQRAQVIVYFLPATPEAEILDIQRQIESTQKASSVIYVSEEEAVEKYKEMFESSYDNASNINILPGILPASLEVKALSAEELSELVQFVEDIKARSTYIEDVWYYRNIIDQIRTLSTVVKYGGATIVGLLVVFTVILIIITIGFNIVSHKDEIEIMHLVGGSDEFIKSPFIFEGAVYGFLGGLFSALFVIVNWLLIINLSRGSQLYAWASTQLRDFSVQFLVSPGWQILLAIFLVQIFVGTLLGSVASYFAVIRYLNKRRV